MRHVALQRGIVDVPNARSSHARPVPRGGGFVIALVASVAFIALAAYGAMPWALALALLGPGACVACVGYLDDLRGVPALDAVLRAGDRGNSGVAIPRWMGRPVVTARIGRLVRSAGRAGARHRLVDQSVQLHGRH